MTQQPQQPQQPEQDQNQDRQDFAQFLKENNNFIPLSGTLDPTSPDSLAWTTTTNPNNPDPNDPKHRKTYFFRSSSKEFVPQEEAIKELQNSNNPAVNPLLEQLGANTPTQNASSPSPQTTKTKELTLEEAIAQRRSTATPQQLAPTSHPPTTQAASPNTPDTRLGRTPALTTTDTTSAPAPPSTKAQAQTQAPSEATPASESEQEP